MPLNILLLHHRLSTQHFSVVMYQFVDSCTDVLNFCGQYTVWSWQYLTVHESCLCTWCTVHILSSGVVFKILSVVTERISDISEEYIVHIFSIKLVILDLTLLHVGVELGLSHLGNNKGWEFMRIECWGRYLGLRWRKWQEIGENSVLWSLNICSHQIQ